jgi:hypothetical protein
MKTFWALILIVLLALPSMVFAVDKKISELGELSEVPATDDYVEVLDTSDTGMGLSGTNKKNSYANFLSGIGAVSSSFTNKTMDAEGTGNVLTIPVKIWLPAAGCDNATATSFWDLPNANAPAAACSTGTYTQKAVLDFDATTDESAQVTLMLPSDFSASGILDAIVKWEAAAITGSVVWGIQTSCVADAETDDPAWNTASTVMDAVKGTTYQTNDAAISDITKTGCAAGELLHLKFYRDADNGSDDMAGDARLIGVMITFRRAM